MPTKPEKDERNPDTGHAATNDGDDKATKPNPADIPDVWMEADPTMCI